MNWYTRSLFIAFIILLQGIGFQEVDAIERDIERLAVVHYDPIPISSETNQYNICETIDGPNDVPVYELVLEEQSILSFNGDLEGQILLFGVDNTFIFAYDFSSNIKHDYVRHEVPAGTFHLAFPKQAGDYCVDFQFTPYDDALMNEPESVTVDGSLTIYEYNLTFDYLDDEEMIQIPIVPVNNEYYDVDALFDINLNGTLFERYSPTYGFWSTLYNREDETGYVASFIEESTLEFTFSNYETYDDLRDVVYGETTIYIYINVRGLHE